MAYAIYGDRTQTVLRMTLTMNVSEVKNITPAAWLKAQRARSKMKQSALSSIAKRAMEITPPPARKSVPSPRTSAQCYA